MFCFCSEDCRERFIANPIRFVVIFSAPASIAPEILQGNSIEARTAHPPLAQPEPAMLPIPGSTGASPLDGGPSPAPASVPFPIPAPVRATEHWLEPRGLWGRISSWTLAWRERRHAARVSRELLALFYRVRSENPLATDRELYRALVMARSKCDREKAGMVLDSAAESFAGWPVQREVNLCDVVHYLSISEFLASHSGDHWMHSDMKRVIAAGIPPNFCVERRVQGSVADTRKYDCGET
jgi:hypothetical protein